MKYNTLTETLFTNNHTLIKTLNCPLNKQWAHLNQAGEDIQTFTLKGKVCDECRRIVLDTSLLKEEEVQQFVLSDPHTCLKVNLDQINITITYKVNEQ
jgi:hypothetical protein